MGNQDAFSDPLANPNRLQLIKDENFDVFSDCLKRCGEVFFMDAFNFVFGCTFCEERFVDCSAFVSHLQNAHIFHDPAESLESTMDLDEKEIPHPVDNLAIILKTEDDDDDSLDFPGETDIEEPIFEEKIEETTEPPAIKPKSKPRRRPRPKKEKKVKDTNTTCKHCGKACTTVYALRQHIVIHSEERPFKCRECDSGFKRRSDLIEHQRRHAGQHPYVCHICGRRFISNSEFLYHKQRHANLLSYQCDQCNKKFNTAPSLRNHKVIHSQERNHACDLCAAKFHQKKGLLRHIKRLHTDDRPHQCLICKKRFALPYALRAHANRKKCQVVADLETARSTEVDILVGNV